MRKWFKGILPECWIEGHQVREVDGKKNSLVYQKGDVRPVLEYFSGILRFCERPGCDWQEYVGPKKPYKRKVMK